MSHFFFQKVQNHVFWNFDFWFLPSGKKATLNYCLCECEPIKIKYERISLSSSQYYVSSKFVAILQQSDSLVDEKMLNYWAENCKLPLVTEKMLYCTQWMSRLQSNNQILIQFLKLRWCSTDRRSWEGGPQCMSILNS